MLVLVALGHPHRTLADLRGKLGRCRGHDGSIPLKSWSRRQTRGGSNQRGAAEQHIKEGKHALTRTRLSCMRLKANAVRL
jgi:hypothetical protein